MPVDELMLRRAIVFGSAVVYWAGVFIQIRRVRQRTGRSANPLPLGLKEQLLWLGWLLVVTGWLALPFLIDQPAKIGLAQLYPPLMQRPLLMIGAGLVATGYAMTLWCYAIMGETWRMGVDRNERTRLVTRGPYRVVRHPIYALQVLMLIGVALLLPAPLAGLILAVHYLCAELKARDEEAYLLTVHGDEYRGYLARTGRLLPRIFR